LFATVVTLMVVPSGYLIMHDLGRLLTKSKQKLGTLVAPGN
jgi:hypothetical protein